ncbi:hypothetical protein [uncultured Pseudokineococcus sp.]|uniref:hypothetical protein n=1 Tax=uncultured Pseudokineococcus sp. TaxID=1642928 RepID=UPI00263317CB|nr:hypothetical protein [uncultured Pseudokineococcus sp.]
MSPRDPAGGHGLLLTRTGPGAAARALDRFAAVLQRPGAGAGASEDAASVLGCRARVAAGLLDGAPRG